MPITPPTITRIISKMHIFFRAFFCGRKKISILVEYYYTVNETTPRDPSIHSIIFKILCTLTKNCKHLKIISCQIFLSKHNLKVPNTTLRQTHSKVDLAKKAKNYDQNSSDPKIVKL